MYRTAHFRQTVQIDSESFAITPQQLDTQSQQGGLATFPTAHETSTAIAIEVLIDSAVK